MGLSSDQNIPLADSEDIRASRARFAGFPNAQKPPFVAEGDTMSGSTFWHGAKLDEWANAWTRYYTGGKGNYMIAGMEDTGTLQSLTFLDHAGAGRSATSSGAAHGEQLRQAGSWSQPPRRT